MAKEQFQNLQQLQQFVQQKIKPSGSVSPPEQIETPINSPSREDEGPQEEPDATQDAGALGEQVEQSLPCPNCGWIVGNRDVTPVGKEDKDAFLVQVLSGKPFFKTFQLLDGKVSITFRSLYQQEADLISLQRGVDQQKRRSDTLNDSVETLLRYHAALQLQRLVLGEQVLQLPQDLQQWRQLLPDAFPSGWDVPLRYAPRADRPPEQIPDTPIWHITRHVLHEVLQDSEILIRLVRKCDLQFNQILKRLEDNATRPDFWKTATGD